MKREVFGAKVMGASHKRSNTPCQDNFHIESLNRNRWVISVADGHGSSKCPRSQIGSEIAVKVFCNIIKKYANKYGNRNEDELISFLNREGEMRVAKDICEEWQLRVEKDFEKNTDDSIKDEEGKYKKENIYTLYGTTILGMLITDNFVFSFQIGDGDINFVSKEGIEQLVHPEKFLGTETHSLSKINAWRNAVSSVMRRGIKDNLPYMYMMSTDGFINSYVTEEDFEKTCYGYYQMIQEHGAKKVEANLGKWLNETSELGCGDDITLVMAYFE